MRDREDSTGFLAYDIQAEDPHLSFGVFVYPPFPLGTAAASSADNANSSASCSRARSTGTASAVSSNSSTSMWRGRTDPGVFGWTVASRGTRNLHRSGRCAGRGPAARPDQPGHQRRLPDPQRRLLRQRPHGHPGLVHLRRTRTARSSTPYHVDLFCVYLWRLVSLDLADATARARNRDAVPLAPAIRRHLGIGNSSGLGTVAALHAGPRGSPPFILARELGFAYAKSRSGPDRRRAGRRMRRMLPTPPSPTRCPTAPARAVTRATRQVCRRPGGSAPTPSDLPGIDHRTQ